MHIEQEMLRFTQYDNTVDVGFNYLYLELLFVKSIQKVTL